MDGPRAQFWGRWKLYYLGLAIGVVLGFIFGVSLH
jgi:hypothetical protein